ncbi:MAG: hypothetical protein KA383_18925 [Phycisphaerae bacterium]|nr:hypothetical protein [Phycisphaerae bacterium]
MMVRFAVMLGIGWGAVGLLCSCSESQEPPIGRERTLGGVKEGAPLPKSVADPGILQDPANYQPAKVPGAPVAPVTAERGATEDAGSGPEDEVRAVVTRVAEAFSKGDIDVVLRAFDAEQLGPLAERSELLAATLEKMALLERLLGEKLKVEEGEAQAVIQGLTAGMLPALQIDVLDAEHVSVTPNLTAVLFGHVKATPALQMVRADGEWKIQLDAPLTEEDVTQIVAYHEQLQTSLDQVVDWAEKAETIDFAELQTMLTRVMTGQPLDESRGPDAEAKTGEQTEEPRPSPRGRGRGRRTP